MKFSELLKIVKKEMSKDKTKIPDWKMRHWLIGTKFSLFYDHLFSLN